MPDQETANNEETSVYLHAELLPHIRQITLQISYPSHLSPQAGSLSPIFHLSNTARLVTVSFPRPFEPITHTIVLPARVSDAARQALETPRVQLAKGADSDGMPRREISFRLSLANDEEPLKSKGEVMDEFVPWTARDMSPSVRVGCRDCKADILRSFHCCASDSAAQGDSMGGWTWKDLPSGNWAEMMDFWHCHKPDPREESNGMTHGSERLDGMSPDEHNSQVKGYGAANSVVSTPGTILVDVATFLVSEVDCANLKKVRLIVDL